MSRLSDDLKQQAALSIADQGGLYNYQPIVGEVLEGVAVHIYQSTNPAPDTFKSGLKTTWYADIPRLYVDIPAIGDVIYNDDERFVIANITSLEDYKTSAIVRKETV